MILLPLLFSPSAMAGTPQVSTELVEIKDLKISMTGATFVAVVAVTRDGGPPLTITDLDATLLVNDVQVGTSALEHQKIKLPKGQAVLVELPASVSLSAGPSMLASLSSGEIQVMATGTVRARALILPRTIEFQTPLYP